MHRDHPTRRVVTAVAICAALMFGGWVTTPATGTNGESGHAAEARVDINRAGSAELSELPGIGPALARRIVEFREANGPFRRVEDLLKVKGIGEKSFQKMKASLTVGESQNSK